MTCPRALMPTPSGRTMRLCCRSSVSGCKWCFLEATSPNLAFSGESRQGAIAAASLSRRSSCTRCGDENGIHTACWHDDEERRHRFCESQASAKRELLLMGRYSSPGEARGVGNKPDMEAWFTFFSTQGREGANWGAGEEGELRGSCTAAILKHIPGFPALARCSNPWRARVQSAREERHIWSWCQKAVPVIICLLKEGCSPATAFLGARVLPGPVSVWNLSLTEERRGPYWQGLVSERTRSFAGLAGPLVGGCNAGDRHRSYRGGATGARAPERGCNEGKCSGYCPCHQRDAR
ncbi:hypothetical protein LZ31DRAFT_293767 [Colletotrichum somersetense]|nr:hypothetical protein LZ31DRAFT_293767 [Colletotrichum somersetense]